MAINVVPTDAMEHVTTGATCRCEPRDQLIQRDGEPDLWLVLHKYVPQRRPDPAEVEAGGIGAFSRLATRRIGHDSLDDSLAEIWPSSETE